ncbi:MAG: copper amine oxidase N-terminal domain-containing protein [Bacillota bacterium]|nr:copper amine oxidase N-terminal domain-containing protein [Bacillota bacterium]
MNFWTFKVYKSGRLSPLLAGFLLVAFLVFSLGVPMKAEAATTNSALWCPNVVADGSAQQLGGLYISESNAMSIKAGDWVSITLPSFTELQKMTFNFTNSSSYFPQKANAAISANFFDNKYTVDSTDYSYGEEVSLVKGTDGSEVWLQALGRQSVTLKVYAVPSERPTTRTFRTYIHFDEVVIKPVAPEELESSDIKVTLDTPSTAGFTSGTVTIGKLLTGGGSTITAASPTSITEDGGAIADITLKEDTAGALVKHGTGDFPQRNTVKLVLSPGFTWDTVTLIPQGGFGAGSVDYAVSTETNGCSALYLKIITPSSGSSPGQILIKASVEATETFTTARDVKVTYGGTNPGVGGEKIAEVTVAKYLVSGLAVAAKSTLDAVAGRLNQQIGNITIAEGMPGDLAKGRLIRLTLPEGAKWNSVPDEMSLEAGNGKLKKHGDLQDEKRTVTYAVDVASTKRTTFCFKNGTVDLALNVPEELVVTVKGPGINSTVTVANVQAPVTLSAAGGSVRIGVQEQAVGALTIQENLVGALRARDAAGNRALLKLTLPSGVRFAKKPTVAVTAGDLEIDDAGIRLEDGDRVLVIPVKQSSATPVEKQSAAKEGSEGEGAAELVGSTLAVQDISLTVDRTLPEGDITLDVAGAALTETGSLFSETLNKLTCVLAKCLTTAPVAARSQVVFTIGSNKYLVGNEEREMDVAPYIKNDRTYGPVRYIAYALGLSDDNILWDAASQTVTFFWGDRTVQLQVGKPKIIVQGVEVSMDVAPEIVPPGRIMLPYRWVASALGGSVEWRADTREVIIN